MGLTMESLVEHSATLKSVFHKTWDTLSYHQRRVISEDLQRIITDERRERIDAAKVLCSRIGGEENLLNYAETLLAGERYAQKW